MTTTPTPTTFDSYAFTLRISDSLRRIHDESNDISVQRWRAMARYAIDEARPHIEAAYESRRPRIEPGAGEEVAEAEVAWLREHIGDREDQFGDDLRADVLTIRLIDSWARLRRPRVEVAATDREALGRAVYAAYEHDTTEAWKNLDADVSDRFIRAGVAGYTLGAEAALAAVAAARPYLSNEVVAEARRALRLAPAVDSNPFLGIARHAVYCLGLRDYVGGSEPSAEEMQRTREMLNAIRASRDNVPAAEPAGDVVERAAMALCESYCRRVLKRESNWTDLLEENREYFYRVAARAVVTEVCRILRQRAESDAAAQAIRDNVLCDVDGHEARRGVRAVADVIFGPAPIAPAAPPPAVSASIEMVRRLQTPMLAFLCEEITTSRMRECLDEAAAGDTPKVLEESEAVGLWLHFNAWRERERKGDTDYDAASVPADLVEACARAYDDGFDNAGMRPDDMPKAAWSHRCGLRRVLAVATPAIEARVRERVTGPAGVEAAARAVWRIYGEKPDDFATEADEGQKATARREAMEVIRAAFDAGMGATMPEEMEVCGGCERMRARSEAAEQRAADSAARERAAIERAERAEALLGTKCATCGNHKSGDPIAVCACAVREHKRAAAWSSLAGKEDGERDKFLNEMREAIGSETFVKPNYMASTVRAMRVDRDAAQRERDEARAELANARDAIRRMEGESHALRDERDALRSSPATATAAVPEAVRDAARAFFDAPSLAPMERYRFEDRLVLSEQERIALDELWRCLNQTVPSALAAPEGGGEDDPLPISDPTLLDVWRRGQGGCTEEGSMYLRERRKRGDEDDFGTNEAHDVRRALAWCVRRIDDLRRGVARSTNGGT